jgi:hypothetical protein
MSTVQTDGSSPVTTSSTDNNGGTIKANGTLSGTFQASATTQVKTGVFGSTVVDNADADKGLSAGTFAYSNQRPVAKKTTTTISGTANDFLQSGAADPNSRRSIHKLEVVRTRRLTTAIRTNKWNEYSGEFDNGYPVVNADDFWDVASSSGVSTSTDNAAAPTQDVPGELTYMQGSVNPKTDEYKSRTN